MGDFRKLLVWQKAHALALDAHRDAARIRGAQNAALRSQLTRAAQSIPANIVEGRGQTSEREFGRFLKYAINSTSELEYHLVVARDIGAIPNNTCETLATQLSEVRKMLHGLLGSLALSPKSGRKG